MTSSCCNLGLRFAALFRERYILRAKSRLKGIEDFDLEHWELPLHAYGLGTWPSFVALQLFLAAREARQPGKRLYKK